MNLRGRRDKDNVDINLISLIDVLLFLVIFFMVSTTFVERSQIALDAARQLWLVRITFVTELLPENP